MDDPRYTSRKCSACGHAEYSHPVPNFMPMFGGGGPDHCVFVGDDGVQCDCKLFRASGEKREHG